MDNYLDTYRDGGIYDDTEYGGPYISRGIRFARFRGLKMPKRSKVVCIGCGNGFEVMEYINQGHNAFGTELHAIKDVKPLHSRIIKAVVPNLPFRNKEFDLLHCTEVLEHIPNELTKDFLVECKRVSHNQFFSIATDMDSFRTHINLQTPSWWYDMFVSLGFGVRNFQFKPIFNNNYGNNSVEVYYKDGITVDAYCNN